MKPMSKSDRYYLGTILIILLFAGVCFAGPGKVLALKLFLLAILVTIVWPIGEYIFKLFDES
jgi:hypothetical protein